MPRPTRQQIDAAARILATEWDRDGSKAAGVPGAYREWAAGIADMIIHEPPSGTLVEYLGVLEGQLGLAPSPVDQRQRWAAYLEAVVRTATG